MNPVINTLLFTVAAYLIGSIPTGSLLLGWALGKARGKKGNGSTGFLQIWKQAGPGLGLLAMFLEILKGAVAVSIAHRLSPTDPPDMVMAGFLVLVGTEFPIFSKFKGSPSIGVTVGVFASILLWMLAR